MFTVPCDLSSIFNFILKPISEDIISLPDTLLWLLYDLGQSVFVTGIRLVQNQVFSGKLIKMFQVYVYNFE